MTGTLRRDPGLWLLLHVRPPGDRKSDDRGLCSVCGAQARFVRNSWVLPGELRSAWPPSFAGRESMLCSECGASRRVRRLADALLRLYADRATSVAALVAEDGFRGLRVAEINAAGRMHEVLASHPGLTYVEYPQEDIQALSWDDASFDLVLTSETLEHVPDLHRALAETRRVLTPGGRHVLTVPLDSRLAVTSSRDGLPEVHHGRGGGPFALVTRKQDQLARWDIGRDFPELLRAAGLEPEPIGAEDDGVYAAAAR